MSIIVDLFHAQPVFYLFIIFILGLLIGSFLNVVIIRLPLMMQHDWKQQCCELLEIKPDNETEKLSSFNLITPRSHCPKCKHQISALENIPVISYLFLKGKCKACGYKISLRYPIIELLTAITSITVAYYFGISIQTFFALLLTWALIPLSMIDFDHQLLPDDITLPFLWLGISINIFGVFTNLESSVIGAIFGYGSLWSVYMIFKLVTGKEGMGFGDFKLLAVFGAWFGWQVLPLIIILSSLVGAIIGISMILFRSHDKSVPIPFGPYLAIAGWISMLWGPYIMSAYLNYII